MLQLLRRRYYVRVLSSKYDMLKHSLTSVSSMQVLIAQHIRYVCRYCADVML
jgi:hypothetical protein